MRLLKARESKPAGDPIKPRQAAGSPLAQPAKPAGSAFRLERVLVPTDFSPAAEMALQYAIFLALPLHCRLTLLHVVPLDYREGDFSLINFAFPEARLRRQAEQRLAEMVKRLIPAEISASTLVHVGPPAAEIVRVARELASDLIVLSTHGRTGLKHIVLGSTAERVVRHASCPVLTVREHGTASDIL